MYEVVVSWMFCADTSRTYAPSISLSERCVLLYAEPMRGFVKVVAGLVLVVSSIALLIGLIGFFAQTVTEQASALLLGSGLAGILFSGMAWLLADIANAVAPEQEPAKMDVYVPVVATPPVMDSFRQKLSELPDEELTRLSHNTSRALPAYKAIMDEIERRKARR